MKRFLMLFARLLMRVMILAGCTDKGDSSSTPAPDSGEPEVVENDDRLEVLALLDGEWNFLPMGQMKSGLEDFETLEFSCETGQLGFARKGLTDYIICNFELGKIKEGENSRYDLLKVTPTDVTENYTAIGEMILDYGPEFQFYIGQVGDKDVLILRDISIWSPLTQYGLTYDNLATDKFYVFERPTKQDILTASQQDAMTNKGKTFYAMTYINSAGVMYLQEMNGYEYFLEDNGKYVPVIRLTPLETDGWTRTIKYSGNTATQYGSIVAYMPGAVKITTNADGTLNLITVLAYYDHGLYFQTGIDYSQYISSTATGSSEEETETAGYPTGIGFIEDPGDEEEPGYVGPGMVPHGAGTMYPLPSSSTAEGAGGEYRDPAVYQDGDMQFMGRWEDVSDDVNYFVVDYGSPQVGGYDISYAFRMCGSGEGHANLTSDRNVLYINQAEYAGRYWSGEFEILPDGRGQLTVTASTIPDIWVGRTGTYARVYG